MLPTREHANTHEHAEHIHLHTQRCKKEFTISDEMDQLFKDENIKKKTL